MASHIIKQVFSSKMMTKKDLIKLTKELDTAFNCVDHHEALEERRGYDSGKQFPADLYQHGVQKRLLHNWLSAKPNIYTLSDLNSNFDAGMAGREWAAFLRVRSPGATVLRVHPKQRVVAPERILCQILGSLIYNFATLVPAEFDRVPDLCRRNFEALAQGGPQGIAAGLRILEALPPFETRSEGILCIVDALNLAVGGGTTDGVRQLTAVLGRILSRNGGHLLFTVAERRREFTSEL
ncbi:hypothetical protein F4861DRAFT_271107 [Xylaria intraflava]|nr:hypothetical protein F4861DRAFT_271107 [Xylaria intraflava]